MIERKTPHHKRRAAGLTLLEVLVATSITALLITLAMSVFISANDTQKATNAVVRNHDSTRVLTELLNQDLNNTRRTSISSSNQIQKPSDALHGGILQTPNGNITYRVNNDAQLIRTDEVGRTRAIAHRVESIEFTGNHATNLISISIKMLDSPHTFTITRQVVNQ